MVYRCFNCYSNTQVICIIQIIQIMLLYIQTKTTGRKAQEDIENEQIPDTIQI